MPRNPNPEKINKEIEALVTKLRSQYLTYIRLGELLSEVWKNNLWEHIPYHRDPGRNYRSWGEYVGNPRIGLSASKACDLISIARQVKPLAEEAGVDLEAIGISKARLLVPTVRRFLETGLPEEAKATIIMAKDLSWRELYIRLRGKDPFTKQDEVSKLALKAKLISDTPQAKIVAFELTPEQWNFLSDILDIDLV